MRLFVGVPIDAATTAIIEQWVSRLGLPGTPVPPQNWHITLRFVGDTDAVGYDRLLAALDASEPGPRFAVRFGGVAGFPKTSKANVGFVELTNPGRVGALAGEVEAAVQHAGFAPEERPYHPHLTLTRNRPPDDLRPFAGAPLGLEMQVRALALYRSHLGAGGARYDVLERFELD